MLRLKKPAVPAALLVAALAGRLSSDEMLSQVYVIVTANGRSGFPA
jgi:hypothetical protein